MDNQDPIKKVTELQNQIRKAFTNSAVESLKKQRRFASRLTEQASFQERFMKDFKNISRLAQDAQSWSNRNSIQHIYWNREFNNRYKNLSSHLYLDEMRKGLRASVNTNLFKKYVITNDTLLNHFTSQKETVKFLNLFQDITFDDLNIFEEIISDNIDDKKIIYEDSTDLHSTITVQKAELVGDMTREELRSELVQAIQHAQSNVSKDTPKNERIKNFFGSVLNTMGQDVAKNTIWFLLQLFFQTMIIIAMGNHDYDVKQQIEEKISENDTVKTVKKAFVKNPNIDKPYGDMAFLRVESYIRVGPNKQSQLASKTKVPKNTVVFPVANDENGKWVQKGNWFLIEVETIDGVYLGWVEQSKVIEFEVKKTE